MKGITVIALTISIFASNSASRGDNVLQNDLPTSRHDSIYFDQLRDSTKKYIYSDITKAEQFAQSRLKFAQIKKLKRWQILSYITLSYVCTLKGCGTCLEQAVGYGKEAAIMAQQIDDTELIYKSASNLSLAYSTLGKNDLALKNATIAEQAAEKLGIIEDILKIYGILAENYTKLHLPEIALRYYKKSLSASKSIDSISLGMNLYNQGMLYHEYLDNYDSALINYHLAATIFERQGAPNNSVATQIALGLIHLDQHNLTIAKRYARGALKLSLTLNIGFRRLEANHLLSMIYLEERLIDSSLHYIDRAISMADTLNNFQKKIAALNFKATIYEHEGDSINSNIYRGLASKIENPKIVNRTNARAYKMYAESLAKNKHQEPQSLMAPLRPWLWTLIAGAILIIVLSAVLATLRYKSKLSSAKRQLTDVKQVLHSEKNENSILSRKLTALSANIASKNESLATAKLALQKLEMYAKNKNVKTEISEAKQHIGETQALDKVWVEFFVHFEKIHPDLLHSLASHYKLSPNDLKLCAFLKMNLTRKEIAQIMHINLTSLHVSLHRLKKKLKLPKGTAVHEFLNSKKTFTT